MVLCSVEKQKRLCIYKLPASGWQSTRDDRSDTLQESCAVQHTSEIQNTTIANIVGQGSLFRTSYLHYIYLSTFVRGMPNVCFFPLKFCYGPVFCLSRMTP
jgi:hypothetical protein